MQAQTYAISNGIQSMLRFKLRERIADLEFKQRRRITLQEIAEASGVSRMTLSKMINQHGAVVRSDVIDALCKYFQCEVQELVQYVGENEGDML